MPKDYPERSDDMHPLTQRRVRLISCSDLYTSLRPGAEGTIILVDALGTLHVQWDCGSTLGLVPGVDLWEILPA